MYSSIETDLSARKHLSVNLNHNPQFLLINTLLLSVGCPKWKQIAQTWIPSSWNSNNFKLLTCNWFNVTIALPQKVFSRKLSVVSTSETTTFNGLRSNWKYSKANTDLSVDLKQKDSIFVLCFLRRRKKKQNKSADHCLLKEFQMTFETSKIKHSFWTQRLRHNLILGTSLSQSLSQIIDPIFSQLKTQEVFQNSGMSWKNCQFVPVFMPLLKRFQIHQNIFRVILNNQCVRQNHRIKFDVVRMKTLQAIQEFLE